MLQKLGAQPRRAHLTSGTSVALISVFSLKQPREAKNENFCYRSSGAQSRPAQRPDKRNFCSIIFRFQLKTAERSKKRRFMLQKLGAHQTTRVSGDPREDTSADKRCSPSGLGRFSPKMRPRLQPEGFHDFFATPLAF